MDQCALCTFPGYSTLLLTECPVPGKGHTPNNIIGNLEIRKHGTVDLFTPHGALWFNLHPNALF